MDGSTIITLIIGLVGGAILGYRASLLAGYATLYQQFKTGNAGRRVRKVVNATRDFTKEGLKKESALADKYRYGLGSIIQNFVTTDFAHSEEAVIPFVVDGMDEKTKIVPDRWGRFNLYVRPVMDDIVTYSFPEYIRTDKPDVEQLHALTELCGAIEEVVMEIDGGYEEPRIVEWKDGAFRLTNVLGEEQRTTDLLKALKALKTSWRKWLELTKKSKEPHDLWSND